MSPLHVQTHRPFINIIGEMHFLQVEFPQSWILLKFPSFLPAPKLCTFHPWGWLMLLCTIIGNISQPPCYSCGWPQSKEMAKNQSQIENSLRKTRPPKMGAELVPKGRMSLGSAKNPQVLVLKIRNPQSVYSSHLWNFYGNCVRRQISSGPVVIIAPHLKREVLSTIQ